MWRKNGEPFLGQLYRVTDIGKGETLMLTLTEATEQTSKSKSTLIRAIKSGKLSAQRNEHGDYRVEPSELFRVYKPVTHQDESKNASAQQADIDLIAPELLEMIREKDQQLNELRNDLKDTNQRLNEHREASRALMSPEQFDEKMKSVVEAGRQKAERQNQEFLQQTRERKAEIDQARIEADEMRQRQTEQAEALKVERARVVALESRGFIDRIFNRPVKVTG